MILIGSQALNHYIPLNRKLHDFDFLATQYEYETFDEKYNQYKVKTTAYSIIYDIDGDIVEIRNPLYLDNTDQELLNDQYNFNITKINTRFGSAFLPTLLTLYAIKKSTADVIKEHKHQYDLNIIEQAYTSYKGYTEHSDFYLRRLAETEKRYSTSKKHLYDFFHKYHIPEYVKHDFLHNMVADLLDLNIPTYVRTITGDTETCPNLYNKLTHDQKVSLMVEESIVLSLERWFIPRMIEDGINHKLVDMFYNNNEAMPTYHILKHVNLTGLKGEAQYVVQFGKDNFFEIEKSWVAAKEKIKAKGGFPDHFYNELFELRKQYRNGIEIGIK